MCFIEFNLIKSRPEVIKYLTVYSNYFKRVLEEEVNFLWNRRKKITLQRNLMETVALVGLLLLMGFLTEQKNPQG